MSEEKGQIPKTGDEEVDKLYQSIFSRKEEILSKYPIGVYNGLIDSVAEFAKNKEKEKKREVLPGANAFEYYQASKQDGNNLTNIKDYYDIEKEKTTNIDRSTQYRMLYPQVVESLKKGNIVSLPETLDLGAYYGGVAKDAMMLGTQSGNRDLDDKVLSGNVSKLYKDAVNERLNLLVNATTADNLFKQFNVDTQDQYQRKIKSDAELVFDHIGKVVEQVTGKQRVSEPSAETKTAQAYGSLINTASGGGKKIGKDIYFDLDGNEQAVNAYTKTSDPKIKETKDYNYGVELAKTRPKDAGNEWFSKNVARDKDKLPTSYDAAMRGFYDTLVDQGEKVVTTGDAARNLPSVVRPININRENNNGVISYSVGDQASANVLPFDKMGSAMQEYVNKFDWIKKVRGSEQGDELGKGWMGF